MILGLCTIQKNRGPWLVEWFAHHYVVGFRKFYFYAHMCTDNTADILIKLSRRLDITLIGLEEKSDRIQLQAFKHTCLNYMNDVDWMCFLDGDEFIFPTQANTMQEALYPFNHLPVGAVGVYNMNFGSSGHITEPAGLITENYRMRAEHDFDAHKRVKSIVKGRQKVGITACSNVFVTERGTVDEIMRPVTWGYLPDYVPSFRHFRFNHYACQSREYYEKHKRHSGHADAGQHIERDETWWNGFNTNIEADDAIIRFNTQLRATIAEFEAVIAA